MSSSPVFIDKINCLDNTTIHIKESNNNSPIIKFVKEIAESSSKERFFDFILENYDALKLMTNAFIDIKKTDDPIYLESTPIFFFSSKLEDIPEDEERLLEEFSKQCKYRLDPKMRSLSIMVQPYQQMLTSKKYQKITQEGLQLMQVKDMVFNMNNLHGYSYEPQLRQGFLDRKELLSLSALSYQVYEGLINQFLQIGVGTVLQHFCWCKKHSSTPYAVIVHGHNEIGDIKCPTCDGILYSGRFVSFNPQFDFLLKYHGGLLPPLIGWHLSKKGIEWTADVKIDQHEYGDIIFKYGNKYYLVECKIRSRNKNRRGIENGIEKAITQAIGHVKYWECRKVNIERIDIFTNELDGNVFQEELEKAINNKAQEINGKKLKVHPIKLIPLIISEMID